MSTPKVHPKETQADILEPQPTDELIEAARLPEPVGPPRLSIDQLVKHAIDKGVDGASMEKLMAVFVQMDTRRARQEFNVALAAFKTECPRIIKDTQGNRGKYAPIEHITETIEPLLLKHGFNVTYDSEFIPEGSRMRALCKLSHIGGHTEISTFTGPTDSNAGSSGLQKNGAAETYGKRRALCNALGITPHGEDNDGADPEGRNRVKTLDKVTLDQASEIEQLLQDSGIERARLLNWLGTIARQQIKVIEDIPADLYPQAVKRLAVTIDKRREAQVATEMNHDRPRR